MSDAGRTPEEHEIVEQCRYSVEAAIDWDCEIIKKYAKENIGVYQNIGLGAKWVLEKEKWAIFLEDDNLPELSFFQFCRELLHKYEMDTRVLWICGTNYLEECNVPDGSSYFFTKNMLPCGWASWSHKFIQSYDGELISWKNKIIRKSVENDYLYKPLFRQDRHNWEQEIKRFNKSGKPASWDYQMSLSMRVQNQFAIIPKVNQIKNIGVDSDSIHGGSSMDQVMTKRFCNLNTHPIDFPLSHPNSIILYEELEISLAKIITYPVLLRFKTIISSMIKNIISIDDSVSLKKYFLGE